MALQPSSCVTLMIRLTSECEYKLIEVNQLFLGYTYFCFDSWILGKLIRIIWISWNMSSKSVESWIKNTNMNHVDFGSISSWSLWKCMWKTILIILVDKEIDFNLNDFTERLFIEEPFDFFSFFLLRFYVTVPFGYCDFLIRLMRRY